MFESAFAKLGRAAGHCRSLREHVTAFMSEPRFELECVRVGAEIQYRIKNYQPPPEEIAHIAGDALHNARAALDHMICELAERVDGTAARNQELIAFPIADSAEKFERRVEKLTARIGDAETHRLRDVRAYREGNLNLWRLHRLNIIDKHRVLFTPVIQIQQIEARVGVESEQNLAPGQLFAMPGMRSSFGPLREGGIAVILTGKVPFGSEPKIGTALGLHEPGVVGNDAIVDVVHDLIMAATDVLHAFAESA